MAFVAVVLRARDKADVARFVIPVIVFAIQFQYRVVPTGECLDIPQEGSTVFAPRAVYFDPAPSVVFVAGVVWVGAAGDTCRKAIEQASAVGIVGHSFCVKPIAFLRSRAFSASVTARAFEIFKVMRVDQIFWASAIACDEDAFASATFSGHVAGDGKFA